MVHFKELTVKSENPKWRIFNTNVGCSRKCWGGHRHTTGIIVMHRWVNTGNCNTVKYRLQVKNPNGKNSTQMVAVHVNVEEDRHTIAMSQQQQCDITTLACVHCTHTTEQCTMYMVRCNLHFSGVNDSECIKARLWLSIFFRQSQLTYYQNLSSKIERKLYLSLISSFTSVPLSFGLSYIGHRFLNL